MLHGTARFSLLFLGHSQLLNPLYPVGSKRQFLNWFLVIRPPGGCFTATLSRFGDMGSPGELSLPVVCQRLQVPCGVMLRPHPNLAPGLAQGRGKQIAEDACHLTREPRLVKI